MKLCSIEGCESPSYARGLCNKHWRRQKSHGDPLVTKPGGRPVQPRKPCAIPDCTAPALALGWCSAHWQRWQKHGDPLRDKRAEGQPRHARKFLIEVVFTYEGDDCLLWPFATGEKGYGMLQDSGKITGVHQVVCRMTHGPAPSPEHEVAHSCGRGSEGCVTKGHLRWATPSQNQMDRVTHGTSNRGEQHPNGKLTIEQVREIRALEHVKIRARVAEQFDVSPTTVWSIWQRRSWSWLD